MNGLDTLDVYFDRRSGTPRADGSDHRRSNFGDRRTTIAVTRWQESDGVRYARQFDIEVNGRLQTNTVFTALTVNGPVADSLFVIPDTIKAKAQPANPTPPPITVTLVELAPNVWRAEGGSTPLADYRSGYTARRGRGAAQLAAHGGAARYAAVALPGKPVGTVINTHHHWDHASGLRAALAANLPIVTHARNVSFVRSIGTARKTVRPDALSRSRSPVAQHDYGR